MRINKFTAAAMLAIGATGVTAGTAYAAPAQAEPHTAPARVAPASVLRGTDHDVSYQSVLAGDGSSVVTTLTSGTFTLTADRQGVTVADTAGNVVGTVPTRLDLAGRSLQVTPTIDRAGTRLTLTPVAASVTRLKDINSQQWFFYELQRASLGGIVGAVIGGIIGLFGIIVGVIPGAIIGGIIGLIVAGGQPLINSGSAYFSGQP
jgi:hypothetical protein